MQEGDHHLIYIIERQSCKCKKEITIKTYVIERERESCKCKKEITMDINRDNEGKGKKKKI